MVGPGSVQFKERTHRADAIFVAEDDVVWSGVVRNTIGIETNRLGELERRLSAAFRREIIAAPRKGCAGCGRSTNTSERKRRGQPDPFQHVRSSKDGRSIYTL